MENVFLVVVGHGNECLHGTDEYPRNHWNRALEARKTLYKGPGFPRLGDQVFHRMQEKQRMRRVVEILDNMASH